METEAPIFQVVASPSRHFSIWPGDMEPPRGWKRVGSYSLDEAEKLLPEDGRLAECIKKIVELLQLGPGWNSYSAQPISPQSAGKSIELLEQLLGPDTPAPVIVPRVQGGVQLEWHTGKTDIEVYIDADNVAFYAEQAGTNETIEAPITGNEHVLKSWVERV